MIASNTTPHTHTHTQPAKQPVSIHVAGPATYTVVSDAECTEFAHMLLANTCTGQAAVQPALPHPLTPAAELTNGAPVCAAEPLSRKEGCPCLGTIRMHRACKTMQGDRRLCGTTQRTVPAMAKLAINMLEAETFLDVTCFEPTTPHGMLA
jgi:hypothetical protein